MQSACLEEFLEDATSVDILLWTVSSHRSHLEVTSDTLAERPT